MGEGIQLGDAVWNIMGDTSGLNQSLEQSSAAVEETGGFFERNSTKIGAAITGAGAVITGVFAKATTDFASGAHEMGMLQEKTGFAAETLGQMVRTFEDAGLGAGDLRRAAFNVRRSIRSMGEAGDESTTTLGKLGLSFEELNALAPEEQFLRVVDALEGVQDANTRTGLASDLFRGKAEQMLLVMGDQEGTFRRLTEAQRALYTQEDIDRAAAYDDASNKLNKAMEDLWATIGRELLPELIKLTDWMGDAVERVGEWIRENPQLTSTILKVTAVIGGLASVLGPLILMLPGLKIAVGAVGVAFAALTAPIGLAVAAIAAAIAIGYLLVTNWEEVTEAASAAWDWLKDSLSTIWEGIKDIFSSSLQWIAETAGKIAGSIVNAIMDPIGTLKKVWTTAWETIVAVVSWAWDTVQQLFGWIADAISWIHSGVSDLAALLGSGFMSGFEATVNTGGAGMSPGAPANVNIDMRGAYVRDEGDIERIGQDLGDRVRSETVMAGA